MVIPENERKPLEDADLIGSFYDTDDGRLVYFPKGQEVDDVTDLPVMEELPLEQEKFLELIGSQSFVLSEKMSELFRQVMDNIANEVNEVDGSVDSAE